jgi:hypothetical protein
MAIAAPVLDCSEDSAGADVESLVWMTVRALIPEFHVGMRRHAVFLSAANVLPVRLARIA